MSDHGRKSDGNFGGLLGGLGDLIEKLGDLAEKGEHLREARESGDRDDVQGVYGFTIRTNIAKGKGGEGDGGADVRVEPFGNVRKDRGTGRVKVHEVAEPMVDLFEEPDHVRVVAELPGIGEGDVKLELHDDILNLTAERGPKKYRKEVLLPASFSADRMKASCRDGVLEIRLDK